MHFIRSFLVFSLMVSFFTSEASKVLAQMPPMPTPTPTPVTSPTPIPSPTLSPTPDGRPPEVYASPSPTGWCGDGIYQPPEQCDNGSYNGPWTATCSISCTLNSSSPSPTP